MATFSLIDEASVSSITLEKKQSFKTYVYDIESKP